MIRARLSRLVGRCHGDSIYCDSNIPYYLNPRFSPHGHSFSCPIFRDFSSVTILILVCILPLINRDSEKYDNSLLVNPLNTKLSLFLSLRNSTIQTALDDTSGLFFFCFCYKWVIVAILLSIGLCK